jgi:hypothetical protein
LNTFSQLPAVKKYPKNRAARKIFGPSYFDLALDILTEKEQAISSFHHELHHLGKMIAQLY